MTAAREYLTQASQHDALVSNLPLLCMIDAEGQEAKPPLPRQSAMDIHSHPPKRESWVLPWKYADSVKEHLQDWQQRTYVNPPQGLPLFNIGAFTAHANPTDKEHKDAAYYQYLARMRHPGTFGDRKTDWHGVEQSLRFQPHGIALIHHQWDNQTVRIRDLITDPANRREGFGTELVQFLEKEYRDRAKLLEIVVHARNGVGILFLEGQGFEKKDEQGEALVYQKNLQRAQFGVAAACRVA